MIIRGFIDESYSGNQKKGLFTLTCVFVRQEVLAWFELAWQWAIEKVNERLAREQRPPITRFHAVDLNGGKGEFEGWIAEERVAFAKTLIRVIGNHTSTHMALTVDLTDLKEIWPEIGEDLMSFAYNLLLKWFMLDIGEILEEEKMGEQIELVVERGNGTEPMLDGYQQLMDDPDFRYKEKFASIRIGSWESDVLLQVADLFSYEAYKDAVRRGKDIADPRRSMAALLELDSVGIRTRGMTRETILDLKRKHLERKQLPVVE